MTLAPGARLGPYEILSLIGAGGMGEVYKARDTKLGREVAIKVLPKEFAQDKERLARFEREARLLASLNHPGIATLYGLEIHEGILYLAMELVHGETLAERIARGPIPIDDALPLFQQISEALEAAHDKGVMHRDLKPANIKVTPEGKVKVLDFGLAKAFEKEQPTSNLSESPTVTRGTATGVILGTAPYMSPEQARGKVVDKRADIWAFGCCLYEALAGKAAFLGETVTDTLAKIVEREPDWQALPERTPALIRRLLHRCLHKDTSRRIHDMADARIEIEEALSGPPEGLAVSTAPVTARPEARWRKATPWFVAALMAAMVGVALWAPWRVRLENAPRVVRTSIHLPSILVAGLAENPYPILSPDGAVLVCGAREGGQQKLFMRRLDQGEWTPIPGTVGAGTPFFSPDSKWVGFFADGKLKKAPLDGVGAVVLFEIPGEPPRGGSWGPGGSIVFPKARLSGLVKIAADGGTPEVLTTADPEKGETHRWPQVLPNGKAALFSIYEYERASVVDEGSIVVQSLETGERRFLVQGAYARYAPTGHLVYARAQTLYAVLFDPDRLEVTGAGVPVLTGVRTGLLDQTGRAGFTFSQTGTLVYVASAPAERRLVLVDLQGKSEPLSAPPMAYKEARFSPDGERLAVITEDGKVHLYELEHDRLSVLASQLEDSSGTVWIPTMGIAWSPDGKRLAVYARAPGTGNGVTLVPVDGRGTVESLVGPLGWPHGWSPDGGRLLVTRRESAGWDIWEVPLVADAAPRPIVKNPGFQTQPALSPDGRWLAYTSNESGRSEVYVRPFDGSGGGRQITIRGGRAPVWAPSGQEIYFRNGEKVMAVEITTEPVFSAGRPRLLFEGPYELAGIWRPRAYDLAPDGQRFVMIESEGESTPTEFHVVQNWFEELKRLVPAN
jgi:serine/threonine-protein kinase